MLPEPSARLDFHRQTAVETSARRFDPDTPTTIVPTASADYATSPGGSLLLTGATSGTRGAAKFATFAAGKHGLRAMSQSLAREFGPHGIHVSHIIGAMTSMLHAQLRLMMVRQSTGPSRPT